MPAKLPEPPEAQPLLLPAEPKPTKMVLTVDEGEGVGAPEGGVDEGDTIAEDIEGEGVTDDDVARNTAEGDDDEGGEVVAKGGDHAARSAVDADDTADINGARFQVYHQDRVLWWAAGSLVV